MPFSAAGPVTSEMPRPTRYGSGSAHANGPLTSAAPTSAATTVKTFVRMNTPLSELDSHFGFDGR